MNFPQAVKTCFIKYVDFSGRACRSEYWWWVLFTIILSFVTSFIDAMLFGTASDPNAIPVIGLLTSLGTLLPGIAVTARRLHDVGRSGWWMLIALTIIGIIPLLIWYCTKGPEEENRFGPNPLASA